MRNGIKNILRFYKVNYLRRKEQYSQVNIGNRKKTRSGILYFYDIFCRILYILCSSKVEISGFQHKLFFVNTTSLTGGYYMKEVMVMTQKELKRIKTTRTLTKNAIVQFQNTFYAIS